MDYRWILDADGGIRPERAVTCVSFDCSGGLDGDLRHVSTQSGFDLYAMRGEAGRQADLHATDQHDPSAVSFTIMLEGTARYWSPGHRHDRVIRTARLTIDSPEERIARYRFSAGDRLQALSWCCSPDTLAGALGGAGSSSGLRALFAGSGAATRCTERPMSRAALSAAAKLLNPPVSAPLQRLYMEGKLLELLALQFSFLGWDTAGRHGSEVSAGERLRLERVRERLLADLGAPPGYADLAREAGMSERRMHAGFKARFGTTICRYLRDARMDEARHLIGDLDLPLKEVAWRVGYAHLSNFITAYRRRFGTTPGRGARTS